MVRAWRHAKDQFCSYCGSHETNTDVVRLKSSFKIYPHWKHDEFGNTMCTTCYTKKYPSNHARYRDQDKNSFLWFGKKIRYIPRIINNQCSICGRKKGQGVKMISMHHEVYIACLPWFGRLEMCQSCHAKIPTKPLPPNMIRMKTKNGKRYCIIISQIRKPRNRKRDSKGRYC